MEYPARINFLAGRVAQWLEQLSYKQQVEGSIPSTSTLGRVAKRKRLYDFCPYGMLVGITLVKQ